ncbi:MAG: hypothetical protein E6I93_12375 [Chloroflexi bacterium]|nr:MAG: hypothetical protein E6I93_12375 [Chloroflexota bacterium]
MNDIMGLFEHLKFVGNMKIENALQKAEDPNQVFNYSYTKQLEQLQQLRQGLVTIVQNDDCNSRRHRPCSRGARTWLA